MTALLHLMFTRARTLLHLLFTWARDLLHHFTLARALLHLLFTRARTLLHLMFSRTRALLRLFFPRLGLYSIYCSLGQLYFTCCLLVLGIYSTCCSFGLRTLLHLLFFRTMTRTRALLHLFTSARALLYMIFLG